LQSQRLQIIQQIVKETLKEPTINQMVLLLSLEEIQKAKGDHLNN
jgi:hypothetical protein